jgi:hypothetical protein
LRLTCILALAESFSRHYAALVGGVAEWSNAPVLKLDNYPLIVSHAIKNKGFNSPLGS